MFEIKDLLALADEFTRVAGVKEETLSYWIFTDSKKLRMMRAGADVMTRGFNAALIWFSQNWPEGAEWPAGVIRPMAREAAE